MSEAGVFFGDLEITYCGRCTLGISYAPGFAADFLPEVSEFYQRTHRVRFKNSDTSDKKSSRKSRHNEIPRAHGRKKGENAYDDQQTID